jgi:hypothetical protein
MILQLSQKFGEIFDDIGIKVLFLVVKFSDRKEGLPTFTKDFSKKKTLNLPHFEGKIVEIAIFRL